MNARAALVVAALVADPAVGAARTRDVPTFSAAAGGASVLLSTAAGRNPYSGIVRYLGRVQCTAVFIESVHRGHDARDAPAYVLTNGHCSEYPSPNDVLIDRPVQASHRVIFNYFADAVAQQVTIPVARVAYATMKGQDVAVLELAARYEDLLRHGFAPWPLARTTPQRDEHVVIVGAPLTDATATSFLRLAACRLESHADVVLELSFHWFDFYRTRCRDIRPGSSGSPVISQRTGQVLGLVNTATVDAARTAECSLRHPCEPVAGGVTSYASTSYISPLAHVGRCFGEDGRFDVTKTGCPLDPDFQVRVTPPVLGAANPERAFTHRGPPQRRWNVAVSGELERYRYKVVAAASGDCRDLHGYGAPRHTSDAPVIDDPLPRTDGYYFLCVIGGTGTRWSSRWQSTNHPTVVAIRIDTRPPQIPARITVNESEVDWIVAFGTVKPEIAGYTFKFGHPGETRCNDPADYQDAPVPFIVLPKANRPYTVCAIPHDSALNPGSPFEAILK